MYELRNKSYKQQEAAVLSISNNIEPLNDRIPPQYPHAQ